MFVLLRKDHLVCFLVGGFPPKSGSWVEEEGSKLKMIIFTKYKMNAIHFQSAAFTSGFRMKTSDFPLNLISTKVQKLIVKIAFPFGVETAIGKMSL